VVRQRSINIHEEESHLWSMSIGVQISDDLLCMRKIACTYRIHWLLVVIGFTV